MSWDIYIQDFPLTARSVVDIPGDYHPSPLGNRSELIARIREVVPSADFSNPDWGVYEAHGYSIEFNMGSSEICGSVMLSVRGGGDPVPIIGRLLDHLQTRGIDCQSGEFFDTETARESFGAWQRYRDQVVGINPGSDHGTRDRS
jgi:hypothetical protein